MSADASVTLPFADGEYKFVFRIGQLRELQEKINKWRAAIGAPIIGPLTLMKQIREQDAWPDDVREILRIGLIAGKDVTPVEATVLLKRYFDERPPLENYPLAHLVLAAGFIGVEWDIVGKEQAEGTATEATMTASSSPHSTEPEPPSDGQPDKSMTSPSGNSQPPLTDTTGPTEAATNPIL